MITDILGSDDSQLGNISLGIGAAYAGNIYVRNVNHTLSVGHTVARGVTRDCSASNTITFGGDTVKTLEGDADNTITFDFDLEAEKSKIAIVLTPITFASSVTRTVDSERFVNQGLPITQSATRSLVRSVSVLSTFVPTHSVIGAQSHLASNVLTISQDAENEMGKIARGGLDFTSIAAVSITSNKRAFTNFIPFQVLSVHTTIRRGVTQMLSLSGAVAVQAVKAVTSHLTLTQDAFGDKVKAGSSVFVMNQAVDVTRSFSASRTTPIAFRQVVVAKKTRNVSPTSALGMSQSVQVKKVINATASSTFTPAAKLVRDRFDELVDHSLDFDHQADGLRIITRSVNQVLGVHHTLVRKMTYKRSLAHTFLFRNSYQKYIGQTSREYVTVPEIQVTKVVQIVVLQSAYGTIVLPAPEFGDSETPLGSVNIKRTMNGLTRVYKKTSISSRLTYDFVIERAKMLELRAFIRNSNSIPITLYNWKGEIWAVLLKSNPTAFTEVSRWDGPLHRGNKTTVTLEFEGVRYH